MAEKGTIKDREIFALGKWRGSQTVTVTPEYVSKMIQSYIELNSKVPGFAIPIKLGHNKRVGEPAFGYAENVRFDAATGKVMADFTDMPPEIVDQIEKKQYNTVSVEIWPKVEYAGQTFENVLSGVALLGAEWPAVKGLKPLSMFAEDGGTTMITLSQEDDTEMPNFTQADLDTAVAAAEAKATLAAEARVTAAEQARDAAQAALASFTDEAEKSAVAAVIEAAEKEGKIVPANKPGILAMAEALRLSVDPAKRKEALATFKTFVEGLAPKVDFSENGKSKQKSEAEGGSAADKVDAAAKALMAEKKGLSYRDALDQVFAADPELKTAYAEENR